MSESSHASAIVSPRAAAWSPSEAPLGRRCSRARALLENRWDASRYARNVVRVARATLGQLLVHATPEGWLVGRIVEAEAYWGPHDRAAHSYGGRRTARTEAMFGPAGRAYLFRLYGQHWHLNLVTGQVEEPQAVLLRAVEPLCGLALMRDRRELARREVDLCNGPGKLCQAFGIDGRHYGADLTSGPLFLSAAPRATAARSPRIGIDYAGDFRHRRWRFYDPESRWAGRTPPAGGGADEPLRARRGRRFG